MLVNPCSSGGKAKPDPWPQGPPCQAPDQGPLPITPLAPSVLARAIPAGRTTIRPRAATKAIDVAKTAIGNHNHFIETILQISTEIPTPSGSRLGGGRPIHFGWPSPRPAITIRVDGHDLAAALSLTGERLVASPPAAPHLTLEKEVTRRSAA